MKRIVLCLLILVMGLSPRPSAAYILPVIDGTNLAQSIARYIVLGKQLSQQVQQYQMLLDQYKDQIENLKNLNPRAMILGELVGRDLRRGTSFLARAQYLDPNSSMWRKDIEALLRQHFDFLDTEEARYIIDSAFPGQSGDTYRDYYQRRDREMTAMLDTYHFQATQHAAARARQDQLEKIKRQFLDLKDRSQLRQSQATNGLLAVVAQQNEAVIDALQLSMTQQAQSEMARRAVLDRAIERDARYADAVRRRPSYQCPTTPCFRTW